MFTFFFFYLLVSPDTERVPTRRVLILTSLSKDPRREVSGTKK